MKRVLEMFFQTRPNAALTQDVEHTNRVLEQIRREHRESLKRAQAQMDESVRIAQEALERRGR